MIVIVSFTLCKGLQIRLAQAILFSAKTLQGGNEKSASIYLFYIKSGATQGTDRGVIPHGFSVKVLKIYIA